MKKSLSSYCRRRFLRSLEIQSGKQSPVKWWNSVLTRSLTTDSGRRETTPESLYRNPLNRLQPYLQIPILPETDKIFDPSLKEIKKGCSLFESDPRRKHEINFVTSAVYMDTLPDISIPEVAFLGRSNVGKSSLIQAMFSSNPEVKVKISSRPGHTRTLNFFQVGGAFTLVDMPGYGFNMPHHFQESVEEYLKTRRRLCRTFLLIDGEVGVTQSDQVGLQMMEELGVPYVLVMTKIDKAGRHKLLRNLLALMEIRDRSTANSCLPQPFLVSSKTGEGIPLLQAFIAYITGCIHVQGL